MATRRSSRASRWSSGSTAAISSKSPAQWDAAKLDWVNAQLPASSARRARCATLVAAQLARRGIARRRRRRVLRAMCALFKDRCQHRSPSSPTGCAMYFADVAPCASRARAACHRCGAAGARDAARQARDGAEWSKAGDRRRDQGDARASSGLKMPQLAPAVRVLVCGRAQTPSLDAVLELFDRDDGAGSSAAPDRGRRELSWL